MSNPLGIAVVGCGYWGPNLARNFERNPRSRVLALCDIEARRLSRMKDLYPEASCFTDFATMLEAPGVEAVVVATPVRSHFALAKAALLAGKHVLVEKPMASSSAECAELIALAKKQCLVLLVGHTYLYSSPVRKIASIIAEGGIGELKYINCQRLNLGLFQSDINVAWDLAPHDLSIIQHVLGEPPLFVNCQGNAHFTPGIEDVTNLSLTFTQQRFATIQSSWLEPRKVRQITFVGTGKMIVYDDLQPLEKIRIHDVRVECPPHYESFAEFQYSYHYGDCYLPRVEQCEPLKVMCSHFIDCVREGVTPLTNGEQGMAMVRILEASSESLRARGGAVPVAGLRELLPVESPAA
ncbi:MAG: gfo/Idh/MocA family oxidoreductase [Verrucomicrobia bacterium]|nr:MAG: gfo/Idh/MocA family oxidoreductase [Verrucomicrobiota bacterium]TAE87377.1 MAG: gfo/Idh/MocA family oxidoreductase [Verrucomicrobiota bacterium]TAF25231.1 MAG: gfo/Idh/MocA family oxidoreductase [Verrucomicrobiota bacterium]TAF40878.1 MAG: gfo/Idh/MocA family oxidoreductase [Verrucomicrobiota bacterium]